MHGEVADEEAGSLQLFKVAMAMAMAMATTCSCSRFAMAGEQRNITTFQSGMKFIWPLMCKDLSTSSSIMFVSSSPSSSSPPEFSHNVDK